MLFESDRLDNNLCVEGRVIHNIKAKGSLT